MDHVCIRYSHTYNLHVSPTLNRISAIKCCKCDNAIEIHNRTIRIIIVSIQGCYAHIVLHKTYVSGCIYTFKISSRIGQVWVAWEGHQEYLLSGGSWGAGVEQLVWVCEGEENECTFEMNCTSHVRSRKVTL